MKINDRIIVRGGTLSDIVDIHGVVLAIDAFGVKASVCRPDPGKFLELGPEGDDSSIHLCDPDICRPDAGEFNLEILAFRDDRHGGIFQVVRVSPGGPWTAAWSPTTLEIKVLGSTEADPGSPERTTRYSQRRRH